MKNFLISATVPLIAGVLGAMGYEHFLGAKAGAPSSSVSSTESGSGSKSEGGTNAESAKGSNAKASTSSSIPAVTGSPEADLLKQQIKSLSQKMDRLGERVDRVQQLLSLAVPLLQRMALKD
jgi:hypothetical protein